MRALVFAEGAIRAAEVPEPEAGPGEVLVEVRHVSLNHGEVRFAAAFGEGEVLGNDAAGVVLRGVPGGPAAGDRVLAFGPRAWAERAVFPAGSVAPIPDGLDPGAAAALPMAGLAALRSLRAVGPLLGRRVLVTGASGGVGRMAVQLARRGGAHVVASVGSPARGAGLAELGAAEVVVGLDGIAPVDAVIESVGGPHLVAAWNLLGPGGSLQSVGWASGEPAVFPVNAMFALGEARTISSFGDVRPPAADLAYLAGLAARGELSPEVGLRAPWSRVAEAARELLARRVAGKAVLDIVPD